MGNKFDNYRRFYDNPKPSLNPKHFNKFDTFDNTQPQKRQEYNITDKIPLNKEYNLNLDFDYSKLLNQSNNYLLYLRHKTLLQLQGNV